MEVVINTSTCNEFFGGVSELYLVSFESYKKRQWSEREGRLLSFPATELYPIEFVGKPTITESIVRDNFGVKSSQSINFKFTEYNLVRNSEFLFRQRFRIVAKDENGLYRLLGMHNGLKVSSFNSDTGASLGDFNQNNITFTGIEPDKSLVFFDLESVGFTIFDISNLFFLLQENGDLLLQENGDKIIL